MDGRTERVCSTYADGQDEDRGARPECHPIQNTPVGEASVRPSALPAFGRLDSQMRSRGEEGAEEGTTPQSRLRKRIHDRSR